MISSITGICALGSSHEQLPQESINCLFPLGLHCSVACQAGLWLCIMHDSMGQQALLAPITETHKSHVSVMLWLSLHFLNVRSEGLS